MLVRSTSGTRVVSRPSGVEQAQLDRGRVFRVEREVDARAVPGRTEGMRRAGPRAHRTDSTGARCAPGKIPDALADLASAWANLLDSRFRVPGTQIRFGLDPILSLVPGMGELVSPMFAVALLAQGLYQGVPRVILVRMVAQRLDRRADRCGARRRHGRAICSGARIATTSRSRTPRPAGGRALPRRLHLLLPSSRPSRAC